MTRYSYITSLNPKTYPAPVFEPRKGYGQIAPGETLFRFEWDGQLSPTLHRHMVTAVSKSGMWVGPMYKSFDLSQGRKLGQWHSYNTLKYHTTPEGAMYSLVCRARRAVKLQESYLKTAKARLKFCEAIFSLPEEKEPSDELTLIF